MPDQPAPNQPVDTIRDRNLKASIWRNESDNGPFYATTFTRSYRDKEGQYHDANSFVAADLLRLSELAREAYAHTKAMSREDREQDASRDARKEAFKKERASGKAKEPQVDYEK